MCAVSFRQSKKQKEKEKLEREEDDSHRFSSRVLMYSRKVVLFIRYDRTLAGRVIGWPKGVDKKKKNYHSNI